MIKIFNPNDTDFRSNGNIAINPLKCLETKKKSLNGWFLDVEVPVKFKDDIKQDMLCVAMVKSRQRPQAFRIKNVKKSNNKIIFQAEHIMFDARDYFLEDIRPTNQSADGALNYINERVDRPSPFTVSSNVNNNSTAYFINRNLLEAWAVIEERWGGTFDADNYDIQLKLKVGQDNGESLNYGADLIGVEVVEDWSNVLTRIYAVGPDGIMLPEKFIDSLIEYPTPYTKKVSFETEIEDDEPLEEDLINELRHNALAYLEDNQYPKVSYVVKSNIRDDLEIGDTVEVKHPLVSIKTEVQEYQYNIMTKKVVSLEFGNYSRDVKKKFEAIKDDIQKTKERTSTNERLIGKQTDLINSLNKNGYVYIDENEILILDRLPKETAKNVWRFGMGGIGFSKNGYEGPFEFAFTNDGYLNTSFIAANTITVNHVTADFGSALDIRSNEAITQIVSNIDAVNSTNIPENFNGRMGYLGWDGKSSLPIVDDLKFQDGLTPFMPALRREIDGSASRWGWEFLTSGEMMSPYGYVVPNGRDFSFRGKVGNYKPFDVILYEYTKKVTYLDYFNSASFELGSLSSTTGNNLTNKAQARTVEPIKIKSDRLLISKPYPGYKYSLRQYDENMKIIYSANTFYTQEFREFAVLNGAKYLRIVVAYVDNKDMDVSNIPIDLLDIQQDKAVPSKRTVLRPTYKNSYAELTTKLQNNTRFVRLAFNVPTARFNNRMTLTELMFTAGKPKEWFESVEDAIQYSESTRTQLSGEIHDNVKEIDRISGDLHNAGHEISALKGVEIYGKHFKVQNEDRTKDIFIVTTIDGQEGIKIVGDIESVDGSITIDSKNKKIGIGEVELRNWGYEGGPKNLEMFTQNLMIGRRNDEDSGLYFYDASGIRRVITRRDKLTNLYADEINATGQGTQLFVDIPRVSADTIQFKTLGFKTGPTSTAPVIYNYTGHTIAALDQLSPKVPGYNIGSGQSRYSGIYLLSQPNVSSDLRLKENIQDIPQKLIDLFMTLEAKMYSLKSNSKRTNFGYIAQEVERLLFKYCISEYGLNAAKYMVERFALLHKDESHLSLLYNEISVIITEGYRRKIIELEERVALLERMIKNGSLQ